MRSLWIYGCMSDIDQYCNISQNEPSIKSYEYKNKVTISTITQLRQVIEELEELGYSGDLYDLLRALELKLI